MANTKEEGESSGSGGWGLGDWGDIDLTSTLNSVDITSSLNSVDITSSLNSVDVTGSLSAMMDQANQV